MSKQRRIYVIIWLTGVWGEQGAALAVDDLLNKRQFLRHRCRNHTEAGHQGIKRWNSSHHSEVGVKVWKQDEKYAYSSDSVLKNTTHTIKPAYFNSHVSVFTDSSVPVTHRQHTHKRLHSYSWINHLVNNMHILRSLQGWAILCHSSCLDNDLNDIVHSRLYKNRALFSFTLQHCTGIHSSTCLCAHMCPSVELFEMEMVQASSICLTVPAEDLESTIMPQDVWCSCSLICAQMNLAHEPKSFNMTWKFIYWACFSYEPPPPPLWKHLPVWVQEADTLPTFKIRLKKFLFEKIYSQ